MCSLLDKPWLRPEQASADEPACRTAQCAFWVEPERRAEFEAASDARRAAWVWRSYVTAAGAADGASSSGMRTSTTDPRPSRCRAQMISASRWSREQQTLGRAHASSVGRYRSDLSAEQLAEVEAEAGALLAELGYA